MLLLTTTADIIKVVSSSASALDVHASYVDLLSGSTATPGRTNTAIVAATTTTVVGSPASQTVRNVKRLSIRNKGAAPNQVTIQHFDGSTTVSLESHALLPNETLVMTDEGPPYVIDSTGRVTFTPFEAAAARDAFGRSRVSTPETLFESKLIYDNQPLFWDEALVGTSSSVYRNADACERLAIGAAASSVIRQTRRYFRYQPGKSLMTLITFNLWGAAANVTKRVGYYAVTAAGGSIGDGVVLEIAGSTVSLKIFSTSATAPVTAVQSAWNIDPFDGTGPSGVTLDWTKTQSMVIDLQWLGVGTVRVGFEINGVIYYAHFFNNSNINAAVYMQTPNLPIRYEVLSTGTLSTGNPYVDAICCTVIAEGGVGLFGLPGGYFRPTVTPSVGSGTMAPILSIRLAAPYLRGSLIVEDLDVIVVGNNTSSWGIHLNSTLGGATAWGASGLTGVEADVGSTTVAGGIMLATGIIPPNGKSDAYIAADTYLRIAANIAGTADILTLVIHNLGAGNETYFGSVNFNVVF